MHMSIAPSECSQSIVSLSLYPWHNSGAMQSQCHASWSCRAVQAQQWHHTITVWFFLVLQGSAGTTVAECNHSVVLPGFAGQCRHNSGSTQSQCGSSWFCRAVQAQQWQDAIKMYTLAITNCADAPPVFAAVLHSNRAAVHQHLDQYTDAVADSLRAKALDPSYAKVTPLQHHATPRWMCCSHCVH